MPSNSNTQKIILNIFKEFKNICEKHNLKYYAIGGTCLGAVRHHGFIPWDDDLDVVMPINDFLKFRNIAKKELNKKYKFIDYLDESRSLHKNFFCKLEDINTTFVEQEEKDNPKKYKGVFIDIMPFSSYPKNKIKKIIFLIKLYILVKINRSKNSSFNELTKSSAKILYVISKPFLFFIKDTKFLKLYENMIKKYPVNPSNDIIFPWRMPPPGNYKLIFPYETFKNSVSLPFEDTYIACPSDYDYYLKQEFGDYMKLPPKNQRVAHNPAVLDLNKSYKEYQEEYKKRNA